MSVEDNLRLGALLRRRDPAVAQTLEEVWRLFPRLSERRTQRAETLSGGERQMLAMGRALMAAPRVLMLDEPSLGLAPNIVREIFAIIAALRERGVSILLVEQNARAALEVADHAYVMETGSFTLSGPASELARDPRVAESYLGARPAQGRT
jgi:branched-chain amino acid transport system ATP-binding protein